MSSWYIDELADAAEAIRGAREETGISQTQLAAAVGTTPPNINAYERGHRVPALPMLLRIAKALDAAFVVNSQAQEE